jgi:hypothetical protein
MPGTGGFDVGEHGGELDFGSDGIPRGVFLINDSVVSRGWVLAVVENGDILAVRPTHSDGDSFFGTELKVRLLVILIGRGAIVVPTYLI